MSEDRSEDVERSDLSEDQWKMVLRQPRRGPMSEPRSERVEQDSARLLAAMRFLADFHGEVNDSLVGVPEDYRGFALNLLHALEGQRPMRVRDVLRVACPKCGATAGSMCKRLTTGRYQHVDGVHKARRQAADSGSSNAEPSAS